MKGSLQVKHGTYYVVVNYKDEYGKPKQKWITTNLKEKGNKTKAKEEMRKILKNLDLDDDVFKEAEKTEDILFVDFLQSYLPIKKQQVEPVTYNAYVKSAEIICNYFKNMRLKIKDL